MSEEKNYDVKDRRKVKLDEDGNAVVQPDDEETKANDHQAADAEQADLSDMPPVDIYSLINSFIAVLVQQTWQWLGLLKNPATDKLETDLKQARVAIDAISALIVQLEPKVTPAEYRELQAMLSDLRMNFVHQSSKE